MTTLQFPDSVKQTGPSTRLVYAAIDTHGPLTLDEIVSQTGVAKRTVKGALSTLRDQNLATAKRHPDDGRSRLYHSTGEEADT